MNFSRIVMSFSRLLQADVTLRGLWSSGYQVVLSYEDQAAACHKELWPEIPYWWANTADAEELVQYLDSQKHLGRPGDVCLMSYFALLSVYRYM